MTQPKLNRDMNLDSQTKDTTASDAQSGQGVMHYLAKFNPLYFHKKGTHSKALIALALVCFFWGTTWIASKEGVRHMPPLQMAGIRQLFGGLCYVFFFHGKRNHFSERKGMGLCTNT